MQIIKYLPDQMKQIAQQAASVLAAGGLIIYPTETCYGLGADATNQAAIDKLLQFKTKRSGKAISVVMADQSMAEQYLKLNQAAVNLYQNFLPGPLTVVSAVKPTARLDARVVSDKHTLGVRIPAHPLAVAIARQLGRPFTATSANVSYQPNPYSLQQWQKQTPQKSQALIDLFIDAGKLPVRPSSTVVETTADSLTVLRQGSVKLGSVFWQPVTDSEQETQAMAGRLIKQHLPLIARQGLVIGLQGEMGAGKTRFAQGVARALGINQPIRSPTFTLMEEYDYHLPAVSGKFCHLDTWRMETEQELVELHPESFFQSGNVIVIEWVDKVADLVEQYADQAETGLIWATIKVLDPNRRQWQFAYQRG